jgi:hypothetical protein
MDTDLVVRAQRGDEEAFASLAVACGDRHHAVAHRWISVLTCRAPPLRGSRMLVLRPEGHRAFAASTTR